MLDGAIGVDDLCKRASELGQSAVAITDHGWIASAVQFVKASKKYDIKSIIGMEAYMATESMGMPAKSSGDNTHLTLLAANRAGYRNLSILTSKSYISGLSYKPRIDVDTLCDHSDGLVVLSGCIGAAIPQMLIHGDEKGARKLARRYRDSFNGRFFIEVMHHGSTGNIDHVQATDRDGNVLMGERDLNLALVDLADRLDIGVVATNDAHYLGREHGEHQDTLLCIGMGSWKHNTDRMRFPGAQHEAWEFYIKSEEEMRAVSKEPWWDTACGNTALVADLIDDTVIDLGQSVMPQFKVPVDDPGFKQFLELEYA